MTSAQAIMLAEQYLEQIGTPHGSVADAVFRHQFLESHRAAWPYSHHRNLPIQRRYLMVEEWRVIFEAVDSTGTPRIYVDVCDRAGYCRTPL